MWLLLTGNLYYFGSDGINRAEVLGEWDPFRAKGKNNTQLYQGQKAIVVVKETVEEIQLMLTSKQ